MYPAAKLRYRFLTKEKIMPRRHPSQMYHHFSYSFNVLELLPAKTALNDEETKKDPLLFGVELELSTDYSIEEMLDGQEQLFFLLKQDSSIRGSLPNRYECVTGPMSYKAQKDAWAKFFDKMDYRHFDTTLDTKNGMHVHLSRDKFSDAHLKSFIWFFMNPINRYFLQVVSERHNQNVHEYCRFVEHNQYTSIYKMYQQIVPATAALGKMSAINISKTATIEVRLFKGIVSFASVLKNLELVDAAFHFTQENVDSPMMYNTLENFLLFIEKNKNQYPALTTFVKAINLTKVRENAAIQSFLHTKIRRGANPEVVYKLLLSNPLIKVTSELCHQINTKIGTKSFFWDFNTNSIKIIAIKRGRIHSLDSVLAGRYTRKTKNSDLRKALEVPISYPFSEDEILGLTD